MKNKNKKKRDNEIQLIVYSEPPTYNNNLDSPPRT